MTWLVMSNGAEQDLSGPGAARPRYTIESLAHQLAQINRYTGATRRPYSVAEHSLLCADMAHGKLVRHFDLVALATERAQLLPFNPAVTCPWPVIDTPGQEVRASQTHNLRSAWREQYHWTEWRDEWLAQATVLLEYVREEAAA